MASSKKVCLYKNCKGGYGRTLFKFPKEQERFIVWCAYAGLELEGLVDINDPRFLCDKHFSVNYISNQSRRKMLVHTAIPEKWRSNIDLSEEPKFNLIGFESNKKRKISEYTRAELSGEHSLISTNIEINPPTILNHKRTSNRISANSTSNSQGDIKEERLNEADESVSEDYQITQISPVKEPKKLKHDRSYEEICIQPKSSQKKIQFFVVKPRTSQTLRTSSGIEASHSSQKQEIIEEDEIIDTEENINRSSIESIEVEDEPEKVLTEIEAIEGYSEFIFNGEKYVQMPKRVFEAEKEKIRKESEKHKILLRKLRICLNKMDLD